MYATKTHPPILGLVAVGRFRNFIYSLLNYVFDRFICGRLLMNLVRLVM